MIQLPLSTTEKTSNPGTYWALEQDPITMCGFLRKKRERYWEYLGTSNLFNRITRNWEYYHNIYPGVGGPEQEIGRVGEEGQFSKVSVNHFRSLLHLLTTYIVQNRPAWDVRAVNSTTAALDQAELGALILDYYMQTKHGEEYLRRAVEHALVLSIGYMAVTWDRGAGDLHNGDPATDVLQYLGDVRFDNPTIFDVAFDFSYENWRDVPWWEIRRTRSRWELAELCPAQREEIIAAPQASELFTFTGLEFQRKSEDLVDFYEFYHRPGPGCPEGRYFARVGDNVPLKSDRDDYPYTCPILHRIVPSEYVNTSWGYTPGFDLQGLQEAVNAEYSTIVTNHNNLGPTKIWFKDGESINVADLEPGINCIQTETEPKPLVLGRTSEEILKAPELLVKEMEYVSGVNAVSRGQPDASYRSGTALGLIDSKTNQYNSPLQSAFHILVGDTGTAVLKILRQYAGETPRLVALAGPQQQSKLKSFSAADLELIDSVTVQSGNALTRTISGRKEIADLLLTNKLVNTAEEYLTLLNTGQLKPLTETIDSQLRLIHEENEALKGGDLTVQADVMDNQILHLKKHTAVCDSLEIRADHPAFAALKAHTLSHVQALMDPTCQALQVALGYAMPQQLQMIAALIAPPPDPTGTEMGPDGKPLNRPADAKPVGESPAPKQSGPPNPANAAARNAGGGA